MYVKIFTSLFDGSMRGQSDLILVFVNLLCHADEDGIVDRHWRAVADETGLPSERVKAAIAILEAPDAESRTPTDEGRRIVRISDSREWGWKIVNYLHYRELRNAEERREYMRDYMRKYKKVNNGKQCLTSGKHDLTNLAKAEAEAEAYADDDTTLARSCKKHTTKPQRFQLTKDGHWLNLSSELRKIWSEAYPAVDIDKELALAKAWIFSDPLRWKKNWTRFMQGWLSRSQDKYTGKPGIQVAQQSQPAAQEMTADELEREVRRFDEALGRSVSR